MQIFLQALLALAPLLLTPLLIYLLAEGIFDFGGGEKDIILALPWFIWSVVFAMCSFILIYQRWSIARWVTRSILISTSVLVGLWVITYIVSVLGIA
jgi:hypothetical protein